MRKFLILCAMVLWLFLPAPVLARAGGGGSGSSGGSGGSSSPSHDHTSNQYDPIGSSVSILGMTAFIFLFPSLPIYAFRIKIRKNKAVCENLLKDLRRKESLWDKKQLYDRVEDIYYHVQKAWTNQDIEAMRPYVSDHIYEQWKMKLNWMQMRKEKNVCKRVRLRNHAVVSIQKPLLYEEECCWFYIEGSMVDYTIDTDTGKLIDGQRRCAPFIEFWKITLQNDQFYLDEIRQKDEVDLETFLNQTNAV